VSAPSALRERRPPAPWVELDARLILPEIRAAAIAASLWQNGTTFVLSTLVDAELPDRSGRGLQWHLSVTRRKRGDLHRQPERPEPEDVRRARRAFGLAETEEDNHHPGVARHFWMPVDPAKRVECECKTDETTVVEGDGYRWTNPKEGPCRGCELAALTGTPCTVHPERGSIMLVPEGAAR
jgi:hypothetical protein